MQRSYYKIIIPARLGSTRLANKMLQNIQEKPLICHTYETACKTKSSQIIVATDSTKITEALKATKADVCLTSEQHKSGTDRIAEVIEKYNFAEDDIIVNLQGDEPFMPVTIIDQVAENLSNNPCFDMATIGTELPYNKACDPNIVKVVFDKKQRAIYFSRAIIPYNRDKNKNIKYYRHLGIYAYKVSFLKKFIKWQPTALEQIEKLEQLRAIENDAKIHIEISTIQPKIHGIDTKDDLIMARGFQ
ncbi:MAG: 3-deoxy-manno-octulosonate cytidylyltransferase [Gammaproteobacteria bacterium]|nr:MAG: 3-deoxy-manno-octulosonate cytidylyltransferase [Gammaproteobacteria bacterium]